ncbi:hypothetical protein [Dapis sp. BLCC M229]|uniref:hypothetical protein n=1 Tax=Dapis sp. BLCC M229 TaxID=3400188 RepID=UPI003CF34A17
MNKTELLGIAFAEYFSDSSINIRYVKLFEKPLKLEVGDSIKVKIERDISTTQPKYEIDATIGQNGGKRIDKKKLSAILKIT